jgi:outer membrane protein assembly factor BamA
VLSGIELAGVEGPERERLLGLLTLRAGDPVRLDRIFLDELEIARDLEARGFSDARVRSSVVPLPADPGRARLLYEVTPGPRVQLAAVDLAGERWSRPRLFLRETGLAAGEPFRVGAVEDARNRLFGTGVFSRVDAEVERAREDEARVTFSLAERPRFRLGYGVRWESDVGTSGVLTFEDGNFLGRAMTLGVRGLYEPDDRSGRLYLRTGGVLGTRISLESFAEQRRRLFPDENLTEDRRELSLQASRPLGERFTARLYARHRTTQLFEMEPDPFFPFDLEISLPLLGAQVLYDTRDDPIDPHAGIFASLDLSGSGGFLGSDFDYVRSLAQTSWFRDLSVAGRPLTWAWSVRLGAAHPFAGQELIRDERFFAGGPYSVRGYEMEGLGPREILGDLDRAEGGEALFALNQELRLPLPWDLTGLAFFDAGQVWARLEDADFDLARSLGLGLRARTPVGLLRLDVAYPLDRRPGDDRYKLYVGFGNAF